MVDDRDDVVALHAAGGLDLLLDGLGAVHSEFVRISFTKTDNPNKPGPVLLTSQSSKDAPGAEVIARPPDLADDVATTASVVVHAVATLDREPVEPVRGDWLNVLHYESFSVEEFIRKWTNHLEAVTVARFRDRRERLRCAHALADLLLSRGDLAGAWTAPDRGEALVEAIGILGVEDGSNGHEHPMRVREGRDPCAVHVGRTVRDAERNRGRNAVRRRETGDELLGNLNQCEQRRRDQTQ